MDAKKSPQPQIYPPPQGLPPSSLVPRTMADKTARSGSRRTGPRSCRSSEVRVDDAFDQSPLRRAQRFGRPRKRGSAPGREALPFTLTRPYLRLSAVGLCLRAYSRPFAVSYFVSIRGSSLREIILPTHFRDRSFSRVGYNHLPKALAAAGKRHS